MIPLRMGWRHLLFANWPVDPDAVAERVPDALSVDTYDGRAWLSVTPFINVRVRPAPLPAALGIQMPELNLRTYVVRNGVPGVYFFSLDADVAAAVVGARLFHHLPYYYAGIDLTVADDRIRFESRRRHPGARPARFEATYRPAGETSAPERGSRAAFLTRRHRLYTESPGGDLRYTDVYHDRWPLAPATATIGENTLFRANGFEPPAGDPACYYSPGVDTLAARSHRWRDAATAPHRW